MSILKQSRKEVIENFLEKNSKFLKKINPPVRPYMVTERWDDGRIWRQTKVKQYSEYYISLGGSIKIGVCSDYTCSRSFRKNPSLRIKTFFGKKNKGSDYRSGEDDPTDNGFIYFNNISDRIFRQGDFKISQEDQSLFREIKKFKSSYEEIKKQKERERREEKKKITKEIKKKLSDKKGLILKDLDKDGNGVIDIVEGDDFMKLVKKHQKTILKEDKKHIKEFVQLSNYLKIKRQNIQDLFSSIREINTESDLKDFVNLLKNKIHSYEFLLFHSLNMVTSIVKGDLITFYEIYESFDKLKIFHSTWEKEVSEQLSNIGSDIRTGLGNLMNKIDEMETNIVSGLNDLSFSIKDGIDDLNNSITEELDSINSSIKFNNLLTGIQTYQMYKINLNTKSLRG